MYYYIYDTVTQQPNHIKEIARIESRLMDIGIKDRITKLSPLRNLRSLVAEAYTQGFETIVAVGEDLLVNQILNVIAGFPFVFGVIPVGFKTNLARLLGMESGTLACDILSGRKIVSLDFGKCNETYFLSSVTAHASRFTVGLDDDSQVTSTRTTSTTIANIGEFFFPPHQTRYQSNPTDGTFNLFLSGVKRGLMRKQYTLSSFTAKKITLDAPSSVPLLIDGVVETKTPALIEVAKQHIRMIVGKKRVF